MASQLPDDNSSGDESGEESLDERVPDEVGDPDLSHSFRPEGVYAVAKTVTGDRVGKKEKLTPNIKALIVTAFLFTLITVVQAFAAKIAHSQALLMDCISMGVDALTYMGNIIVECRKRDGTDHKGSQLIVCAISLSCLLYFTYDASRESWATIQVCRGNGSADDGDDVNGWITLGFGSGGVIFDLISLWAFYRSNRKQGDGRAVNMFTALLHVAADFLRSTSTVIMSLLILVGGFDSTCLDAYTSILIGASIVVGGIFGLFSWAKLFYEYFCKRGASDDNGV